MSNPYESIYVKQVSPEAFEFEDAFGFNKEVVIAETAYGAVIAFKNMYPQTEGRAFKNPYTFESVI